MPQTRPDTSDRPSKLPWPPILLVLVIVGAVVLGRVTDHIVIPAFKGHVADSTI